MDDEQDLDTTPDDDIVKKLHDAVEDDEYHAPEFETDADGDVVDEDFEHDGREAQ